MKGIVFNIFQDFVEKNIGEDAWDDVLDEVELDDDVFVAPETYSDESFLKIVTHTITKFKLVPSDAIKLFGRFCFPVLISKVPQFREDFKTPSEFLKNLDSIIHVEVKKLLPGAETPRFFYEEAEDGTITLRYESKRDLPDFAAGLIEGLAKSYDVEVKMEVKSSEAGKHTFLVEFF